MREYKELEIILSDYACDKGCPYCTAKITKWDTVEDNIQALELNIEELKRLGYRFKYLTIGGNGEPTLHSYSKLKEIVEIFKDYDIPVKRVLTSGNIFREREREKFELFNDAGYSFEITVTSFSRLLDMDTLCYSTDYFKSESFKEARDIRVNYVMLKRNRGEYLNEIKGILDSYDNIHTASIKLLNVNTKSGLVDNPYSEWIVDNAISKDERDSIRKELDNDKELKYVLNNYDTFTWKYRDKEIYFSSKRDKYGTYDLVWYGDRFIDYSLREIEVEGKIPKVYIAKRFDKRYSEDGELLLDGDIRDKKLSLIGRNLRDYASDCFIDIESIGECHYIEPFFNERASNGELTSSDCDEVVRVERGLVKLSDIFICYIDSEVSVGSISELVYAATLGKRIIVYYKNESEVEYSLKSSSWFGLKMAEQIVKEVGGEIEIIEQM